MLHIFEATEASMTIYSLEESKNNSVLGNCEKNQTAKYKKISSKYGNEEIKEITTNQLSKDQLEKHEMFMKIALEIAIKSKVKFVSIIVSPDDRVLCSGVFSKENAILHSELVAITNCSSSYKMVTFENHTIYSTAEPDSLSSSAIVWARFKQVVYGSSIKHLYCNACFSSLPIDSNYIFSRGYGIGVENIQLVAGVLQDQTDANFGSYCNSATVPDLKPWAFFITLLTGLLGSYDFELKKHLNVYWNFELLIFL
ncbi:hypothetical protein ACTFIW_005753 [Dictyostelium discoideum]